jgi:2-methylthioadenine synthetase
LVESVSKNNPDCLTGRTETNKVINFPAGPDLIGKLVNVKIIETHTWNLLGELI